MAEYINPNVFGFFKKSVFIILLILVLLVSAFIWILCNHASESTYFLNFVESKDTLVSLSAIGFILGFFYLFYYIEQHRSSLFLEESKAAQTSISVFMLFKLLTFILPLTIIYLIVIDNAYAQVVVLIVVYLITALVFKPLANDFLKIMYNYKILDSLEPQNLIKSPGAASSLAKTHVADATRLKVSPSNGDSPVRAALKPYVPYLPAWIKIIVTHSIVKESGPFLKSSIIALTFMTIFIMLPAIASNYFNDLNSFIILYILLTLIFWFWVISVTFFGFPEAKLDVYLKNGKVYEKVYKVETNPSGFYEYLDKDSQVINVKREEIEKEITIKNHS